MPVEAAILEHSTTPPPAPAAVSDSAQRYRLARCPRPDCGGRLLVVDLDLEETAVMCILCARTQPGAFAAAMFDEGEAS